jgi:hypothetical protein
VSLAQLDTSQDGNRIAITVQVSTIKSVGQEMVHLGMRSKLAHELIFIFPLP